MAQPITGALLYNLVSCPRRVALDLFGDPNLRDPISAFVQMLWARGNLFERETIAALDIPFLDLSKAKEEDKELLTLDAMRRGEPLIYSGRISAGDLLGVPDLLRKSDGGYVPGDIKSGMAKEGGGEEEHEGKPKLTYAVQLAIYLDVLERLGFSAGRRAFVWDVRGDEVIYDFTEPRGPRTPETLWDCYQEALADARSIMGKVRDPKPARAAMCKLCHWHSLCLKELEAADDLTLIPQLGRSRRELMEREIPTVSALAECNLNNFIHGEHTHFHGINAHLLKNFHSRAQLLKSSDPKPYLKERIVFPTGCRELFFDIESDPMRDSTYLHGFLIRENDTASERYVPFFCDAATPDLERRAFADAISLIKSAQPATLLYYSKYERTVYRKLPVRYSEVCSSDDIEQLFDHQNAVDLYFDVVLPATEWPTHDFSIKTLAKVLGFSWRDTDSSGAASIEWFNKWIETREPQIKQRILDYNEDDCRASRCLLDGIKAMAQK